MRQTGKRPKARTTRKVASLTPREAKLLVKYLDGIDEVLSRRLQIGFSPDEEHLNALLCEMLDNNFTTLNALPYTLEELNADLEYEKRPIRVSLNIETNKYPRWVESRITSADLGIVIAYQDHLIPTNSFDRCDLLQAKKLYHRHLFRSGQYTLNDAFKAFNTDQLKTLSALQDTFSDTEDGFGCYLFYLPRPDGYENIDREAVYHYLVPTDYHGVSAQGRHLYEYASDPDRYVPGLIASQLDWLKREYLGNSKPKSPNPTARQVFEQSWQETFPFSWYIVYRILMGNAGSSKPSAIDFVRGQSNDLDFSDFSFPRYTLTVSVSVGTAEQ
jgi:hypothetical protein